MSTQVFKQVPHKSLREATLLAIRQAIIRGDLKPGQWLVESDIAHQMGISRAPVREALRQLGIEGVVRLHTEVVGHIQNGRAEEAGQALACHILKMGERIRQEQDKEQRQYEE